MEFNLKTEHSKALEHINQLSLYDKVIEIKTVSQSRSNLFNRALHKFFQLIADELNNLGMTFNWEGLKGEVLEMPYTAILIKETLWRPLQIALFDIQSTKDITHKQANQIIDTIIKFFGDKGIQISFPCIEALIDKNYKNSYLE